MKYSSAGSKCKAFITRSTHKQLNLIVSRNIYKIKKHNRLLWVQKISELSVKATSSRKTSSTRENEKQNSSICSIKAHLLSMKRILYSKRAPIPEEEGHASRTEKRANVYQRKIPCTSKFTLQVLNESGVRSVSTATIDISNPVFVYYVRILSMVGSAT